MPDIKLYLVFYTSDVEKLPKKLQNFVAIASNVFAVADCLETQEILSLGLHTVVQEFDTTVPFGARTVFRPKVQAYNTGEYHGLTDILKTAYYKREEVEDVIQAALAWSNERHSSLSYKSFSNMFNVYSHSRLLLSVGYTIAKVSYYPIDFL